MAKQSRSSKIKVKQKSKHLHGSVDEQATTATFVFQPNPTNEFTWVAAITYTAAKNTKLHQSSTSSCNRPSKTPKVIKMTTAKFKASTTQQLPNRGREHGKNSAAFKDVFQQLENVISSITGDVFEQQGQYCSKIDSVFMSIIVAEFSSNDQAAARDVLHMGESSNRTDAFKQIAAAIKASTNVKVQLLHVATSKFKLQQPPTKLFMFKGRPRSAFFDSIMSRERALQMASAKHHIGSSEAASFQTTPQNMRPKGEANNTSSQAATSFQMATESSSRKLQNF
ncbi:hypothetical protein ACLOJK_037386 [Asimina triloba]